VVRHVVPLVGVFSVNARHAVDIVAILIWPLVDYTLHRNNVYSFDLSVYVPGSCSDPRASAYNGLEVSLMDKGSPPSPLGTGTLGDPQEEGESCHLTSRFGVKPRDSVSYPYPLFPPVCRGFRGEHGNTVGNAGNGKASLQCDLK
jgi:hypothetical protein